jgi:hypothetical protein
VGFYALNRFVTLMVLDAVDIGGAQTVHLFGAAFGLGVVALQTMIGQLLQEDKERLKDYEKDKQVHSAIMLSLSLSLCLSARQTFD